MDFDWAKDERHAIKQAIRSETEVRARPQFLGSGAGTGRMRWVDYASTIWTLLQAWEHYRIPDSWLTPEMWEVLYYHRIDPQTGTDRFLFAPIPSDVEWLANWLHQRQTLIRLGKRTPIGVSWRKDEQGTGRRGTEDARERAGGRGVRTGKGLQAQQAATGTKATPKTYGRFAGGNAASLGRYAVPGERRSARPGAGMERQGGSNGEPEPPEL